MLPVIHIYYIRWRFESLRWSVSWLPLVSSAVVLLCPLSSSRQSHHHPLREIEPDGHLSSLSRVYIVPLNSCHVSCLNAFFGTVYREVTDRIKVSSLCFGCWLRRLKEAVMSYCFVNLRSNRYFHLGLHSIKITG